MCGTVAKLRVARFWQSLLVELKAAEQGDPCADSCVGRLMQSFLANFVANSSDLRAMSSDVETFHFLCVNSIDDASRMVSHNIFRQGPALEPNFLDFAHGVSALP
jgi:hypothetical protein